MLIVCSLGCVGNIAGIFVFGKSHHQQRNFYKFMFFLAILDLIYVLVSILVFILPQLSNYYKNKGPWHYIVPWAIPVGQVSMTGSVYFTTAITIERYLTVCHPFYMVSRHWNARFLCLGIMLFSISYNIPKFFEISTSYESCYLNKTYEKDTKTITCSSESCEAEFYDRDGIEEILSTTRSIYNVTEIPFSEESSTYLYSIKPSSMRLNSVYVQVYAVYLNFLVNGILPFALVIILNILIIKELKGIGQDQTLPAPTPGNFLGLCDQLKSSNCNYCQLSLINYIMVLIFQKIF